MSEDVRALVGGWAQWQTRLSLICERRCQWPCKCITGMPGVCQQLVSADAESVRVARLFLAVVQVQAGAVVLLALRATDAQLAQALGYYCSKFGVMLQLSHAAGERNIRADQLSRARRRPAFFACNQRSLDLAALLQEL